MNCDILIVEDDPKTVKLLRDLLGSVGYITTEAGDGKQAVTMARKLKPSLILMDIHLPVMSGKAATRLLKADSATKNIPVIALTASIIKEHVQKMYDAGCDDYLSKPFSIKPLMDKISEYLPPAQSGKD